jgi:hypothetical protein
MDRIISMVLRQVIFRLVNLGMDKGIDAMSRKQGRDPEGKVDPTVARQNAETKQRARQGMRMARRFGRF